MIKRLIELMVLLILVVGFVYLISTISTSNPAVANNMVEIIKWLIIGIVAIIIIIIIGAIIVVVLGLGWLKSITGLDLKGLITGNFKNGVNIKNAKKKIVTLNLDNYPHNSFTVKSTQGDIILEGNNSNELSLEVEVYAKNYDDVKELYFENGKLKAKSSLPVHFGDIKGKIPFSLKELTAKSTYGDISLKSFEVENLIIEAVNDDINLTEINSNTASVKGVSSDVRISNSKINDLEAKTVNGDVDIEKSEIENASVKTVNGDITNSESKIKHQSFKTVRGEIIEQ